MRGETTLTARLFNGVHRGVLVAESVHPNKAHIGGYGINMLTGAEAVAPVGGAAFHDNKVWVKKAVPAILDALTLQIILAAAFSRDFAKPNVDYANLLRLSQSATKPAIARAGTGASRRRQGTIANAPAVETHHQHTRDVKGIAIGTILDLVPAGCAICDD